MAAAGAASAGSWAAADSSARRAALSRPITSDAPSRSASEVIASRAVCAAPTRSSALASRSASAASSDVLVGLRVDRPRSRPARTPAGRAPGPAPARSRAARRAPGRGCAAGRAAGPPAARGPAWPRPRRRRAARARELPIRVWSCWPWMTSSWPTTSASTAVGTPRPPSTLRPRVAMIRAAVSPSSSRTPPASVDDRGDRPPPGASNQPSTAAWDSPTRTSPASARPPASRPSPLTTMVLPAPVSPVTAVNPGANRHVASAMTPSPVIRSSWITGAPSPTRATPGSAARTWRRAGR